MRLSRRQGGFLFVPLIFSLGGAVAGGFIGGGAIGGWGIAAMFGLTGTQIGGMLGMMAGGMLGNVLFPAKHDTHWPELGNYPVQKSTKGPPLQKVFGTCKIAGNFTWEGEMHPYDIKSSSGGIGKGGGSQTVGRGFRQSFLIDLGEGPMTVGKIWADNKQVWPEAEGDEEIDVTIFEGVDNQGIKDLTGEEFGEWPHNCCVFFNEYDLGQNQNKPNFTFECGKGYPTLRPTALSADLGLSHVTPISDVNGLQDISLDLSGNYFLTNNIDASATSGWNGGAGFEPIGWGSEGTSADPFTGTLDGCGYTISNLFIDRPDTISVGLFGAIENGAKIANLTLANVDITGERGIGALVGMITLGDIGNKIVYIRNCHVSGEIKFSGDDTGYVGGFVGWGRVQADSQREGFDIRDCSSAVNISPDAGLTDTSYSYIGGFIGETMATADTQDVAYSIISNCYVTGEIDGGDIETCGGFVGYGRCHFEYCYATGDVIGDTELGGFAGQLHILSIVEKCYAKGNVTSITTSGTSSGAAGFSISAQGTVTDCYAWGNVTTQSGATYYATGFIYAITGTVSNCYSIGNLTASIPELLRGFSYSGTGTSCYWDTETTGTETSQGGTGKTTIEMQTQSNYVGWDFEEIWRTCGGVTGDENFATMIREVLTSKQWACGFDTARVNETTLTAIEEYCENEGLNGSIDINEQKCWRDWLDYICSHFAGYYYESGGQLCLGAFRAQDSVFNLSTANTDFVIEKGPNPAPPISVKELDYSETFNRIKVVWTDRENDYDVAVAVANDEIDQRRNGVREKIYNLEGITNGELAQKMAYRLLIDSMWRFKLYSFVLTYNRMLIEQGDVGTISDGKQIVNQKVRILKIDEEINGRGLAVLAVEDISGLYPSIAFQTQPNLRPGPTEITLANATVNYREDIDDYNLYLSITPGSIFANGWYIYRSYDNVTYDLIGRCGIDGITGGDANSAGTISGHLPAHPAVTWAMNESVLVTVGTVTDLHTDISDDQFWNSRRLAKIGDEIIAFMDAEETETAGVWRISNLRRGLFGTEPAAHNSGETFCTLDVDFLYKFREADVGQTLYFKALTYYWDKVQNISSVSGYGVQIMGYAKRPAAAALLRLSSDLMDGGSGEYSGAGFTLYWNLGSRTSGLGVGGHDVNPAHPSWFYPDAESLLVAGGGALFGNYIQDPELQAVVLRFEQADGTLIGEREIAVTQQATITKATDLGGHNPARIKVIPRRSLRAWDENLITVNDGT